MNPAFDTIKQVSRERTRQLLMALEFMPKEQLKWRAGKCGKSPLEVYLECGGNILMAAKLLRGETAGWQQVLDEVLPKAMSVTGLDEAKGVMDKYLQEFFSALNNVEESRLAETIDLPWGGRMELGEWLQRTPDSICYYCGQLAYVQSLLENGKTMRL
jgi:hypothetical protein